MRVLFVCSSGGHLAQLYSLQPWWRHHERMWVTFKGLDSASLLADERVAWAYHPVTRHLGNLLRNLGLARRVLSSWRPDLVVSSGAGVAVPFFLLARLSGRRTVYVEVYERTEKASLTGRLCYPLTDLFLLQLEEQRRLYPRGVVIGTLL